MKNKRVGVLMGGPSSEREISIKSGKAVCRALEAKKIDYVAVELQAGPNTNGYKKSAADLIAGMKIDAAFIVLHGEFGEDGTVQEILEQMKMPYTGSSSSASRVAMNKITAKEILKSKNIPVARHEILTKGIFTKDGGVKKYFKNLGPNLVIKPSNGGSSIGLNMASDELSLKSAIDDAFKYDDKLIIEEYIPGREITVGILEDAALPIVEILPKRKFFDYTAKYEKGMTEYIVPAEIEKSVYKMCQDVGLGSHRALSARSFSRVDIILNEKIGPVVLEINTIPGFTQTSLLPKAAGAIGIGFEDLCIKILDSALSE
ncbi:MAG: D-alanine--D-alanine ligase [Candidatus Omnitrophica bacterium CG_4_9_14_0_2_um_filter_42_8]|nr:MAG: D-alanine--D-alanine ligase [Candidatus Omnitrophica bacterium CG_4_9_14_0_2_um_filter_42_8]